MLNELELFPAPRPPASPAWIITFSDLIALLLVFFVMLVSVSANDPSRVDSVVSSVTEEFAKSAVLSEFGTVASQTGVVIPDQDYLDSVVTKFRGRDVMGEVKLLRNAGGTMMVRLNREAVFIPRTGVLSPEGMALTKDIANAMQRRGASGITPNVEIRITGAAQELSAEVENEGAESPVIIRQASRFARALVDAQVSPKAISAVIMEGSEPLLDLAFYSLSDEGNNAAGKGRP